MSSESGFSTKSNAPILIARTADSMFAVAGDQHDLRVDLPLAQTRECREAVHARQPHVEHDQIDRAAVMRSRHSSPLATASTL